MFEDFHKIVKKSNEERRTAIDNAKNSISLTDILEVIDIEPLKLSDYQIVHFGYGDVLNFHLFDGAWTVGVQRVSLHLYGELPENNQDVKVEFSGIEVMRFYEKTAKYIESHREEASKRLYQKQQ